MKAKLRGYVCPQLQSHWMDFHDIWYWMFYNKTFGINQILVFNGSV